MTGWKPPSIRPFRPAAAISRATVRALVVANEYLETEVAELMKAVSHAYARGRFNSYSG